MPIYVVERRMVIGNLVVAGKLGPDLSCLELLAESCLLGESTNPDLADYKGRVRQGIRNPGFGSKCLHFSDPEFGVFGVRFYEKDDQLTTWTIATLWGNRPLSSKAIKTRRNWPPEHQVLKKEEINRPPIALILRYHPSTDLKGREIFLNHILAR